MDISKAIVVSKMSKYEMDLPDSGYNHDKLMEQYRKEGTDADEIYESHLRQEKSRKHMQKLFDPNQFVTRFGINEETARNASFVVALGGDNHFQYVSHFLSDVPIIGVNSDCTRSDGGLLYFTSKTLEKHMEDIEKDKISIEEWPRLQAEVGLIKTFLATSEIFVGVDKAKIMSRYLLEYKDKREEQKSSGIIVATGAGSTGWYDAACRYLHQNGNKFSKTDRKAKFVLREPWKGRLSNYTILEGELTKGEELTIQSLKDDSVASIDCLADYEFDRGAKAVIKIGKSLKVIKTY